MTNSSPPRFKALGRPCLIGSLPLTDHRQAIRLVLASTSEIPLWPQLPAIAGEGMLSQFSEGLPGLVEEAGRSFFTTQSPGFEEAQLAFYEEYLKVNEEPAALPGSRFGISRGRAAGLYHLAEAIAGLTGLAAVKGQITGPFTLLTGLRDHDDRLGYYDPTVRDLAVKDIAMKAAWQVTFLRQASPFPVLIFIDEPALAGLGSSAFVSVAAEDIRQDLSEVINAVHQAGGLAGVHVCANTDWALLLGLNLDIISFDAYHYFERFITCRPQVLDFLERGGIVAWGTIPTSEPENILAESADSLVRRWEEQAARLGGAQLDLSAILAQSLITPSCGTGSLTPELAGRVLTLTREVSTALRQRYGRGS